MIKAEIPFCPTCTYSKATRKTWKGKVLSKPLKETEYPGQCVSVDSFELATARFTAQIKGVLTKKRYRLGTIYVAHFSDLSYAFLQENETSKETLKGKLAFEQYARELGVEIEHYHADNGRFMDNAFINHVK